MKKIVLKVSIVCLKCKTAVMKAVAKLEGIDEITVDTEKGKLTVIGEVDAVLVVKQLRKIGKVLEIDSIGPVKNEKPKPLDPCKLPPCCDTCRSGTVSFVYYDYPNTCNIL